MFFDPRDPTPPPPGPAPRRPSARGRDEDMLLGLIVAALLLFVLAPFCGGTLWAAAAALL